MSVTVEQLPGEPIFIATFSSPLESGQDVSDMFKAFFSMRAGITGALVLILDLSVTVDEPYAFGEMVIGMATAAAQIRVARTQEKMSPPHVIFVGTGEMLALAADALGQAQYSGAKARTCTSRDDAITLARTLLSDVIKSP